MDWILLINIFSWSVLGGLLSPEINYRSWKLYAILGIVLVIHITAAALGAK